MLNRLHWYGHVQRMEENIIPKEVLYMNLEAIWLRGRPRNRRQHEVRKDGRLVGGKVWKERIYNRVEWKNLLRVARNHHILHMPMEEMECTTFYTPQNTYQLKRRLSLDNDPFAQMPQVHLLEHCEGCH